MRKKYSIQTYILLLFTLVVGFISIVTTFSHYTLSKSLALEATAQSFMQRSHNISKHMQISKQNVLNILNIAKINHNLYEPITFNYKHPALHDILQFISIYDDISSIYFTDKNRAIYEVLDIDEAYALPQKSSIPKQTRWIVLISKDGKTLETYLDKNQQYIGQHYLNKQINIQNRLWFQEAIVSEKPIITDFYKFQTLQEYGYTYAISLPDKQGVFAIDYTTKMLNKFLQTQKDTQDVAIFLFSATGTVLASSDKQKELDPVILHSLQQNNNEVKLHYTYNHTDYFMLYKPLGKDVFLGIKTPTKKLFAPFVKTLEQSLLFSLLAFVMTLPLIFYITNKITHPIKLLVEEKHKIKKRAFDEVHTIRTPLRELSELSHALVSMSRSISAYQNSQAELLDAIVRLIAKAIDAKSPYTGGHCARVPKVAELLLSAASKSNKEPFERFSFDSQEEKKEFEIGAWLHDCGKVTTPEYVIDKATKLETIYNRIHEIRTRFEVLWRDAEIAYLREEISRDEMIQKQQQLQDDFAFIASVNIGGEFMTQEKQSRVQAIAQQRWVRHFDDRIGLGEEETLRLRNTPSKTLPATEELLSDKQEHIIKRVGFNEEEYKQMGFKMDVPQYLYNYGEVYNLCIEKGTLTPEERYKINEHVIMSIKMLEEIPFPEHMKRVPEYAGTHHETLIGTGYPRKLTADELSIPARIMAIADIFEALTASDRPYKKAKTLSEALRIMSFMVKDKHIDADLFELFVKEKIYLQYGKNYLKKEQIDEIDEEQILS